MDKHEEKALNNIEKNGCHIIHVEADDIGPSFTYSIGIEKTVAEPEVIVTGLDRDMSHFLVNEYNHRIRDGEVFEADKLYDDFLEGFQITFKEVNKRHYPDYFGWGTWLYKGDDFRVLHLIWPDTNGIFPWDKKVSKECRRLSPVLYK